MIRIFLIASVLFLAGCSSQEEGDFNQGQKNLSQGHTKVALSFFERVVKRNSHSKMTLEAARESARISFFELKDYPKAIEFHHFIVLSSPDEKERLESQKQIASIYFNNLQNYQAAIVEYSKLQEMPHTEAEAAQYKLNVARSQYYLNNFFQAESEIDNLLKLKAEENIRFNALMLKGNILIGKKEYLKAADLLKNLMQAYPQKALQENVPLTLAVCYEENSDYKNAIRVLEEHKQNYHPQEYIELRIKKLQERLRNAPGAKGFRK